MLFSTNPHLSRSQIHVTLIVDLTGEHQARVGGYAAELGSKRSSKPLSCVSLLRTHYHKVDNRHPIVVPRHDTDSHDRRKRCPLLQVANPCDCQGQ
jgi:hypothetical protein